MKNCEKFYLVVWIFLNIFVTSQTIWEPEGKIGFKNWFFERSASKLKFKKLKNEIWFAVQEKSLISLHTLKKFLNL